MAYNMHGMSKKTYFLSRLKLAICVNIGVFVFSMIIGMMPPPLAYFYAWLPDLLISVILQDSSDQYLLSGPILCFLGSTMCYYVMILIIDYIRK